VLVNEHGLAIERWVLAPAFEELGAANHGRHFDVVVWELKATQPGPVLHWPRRMSEDNETKRKRTGVGWFDEYNDHGHVLSSLSPSSRQLPTHFYVPPNIISVRKGGEGGGLSCKLTLGYIRGIHTRYKLE